MTLRQAVFIIIGSAIALTFWVLFFWTPFAYAA